MTILYKPWEELIGKARCAVRFGVLTVFGTGNATQVNTIVTAIDSAVLAYNTSVKSFLPTLNLIVGVVVAMLVAMVLLDICYALIDPKIGARYKK